ncbi:MAG TPA: glycosyl hydrolase family 28 protein [Pyrinomonadaceae bacterium]|nr:glycosyl hydrolase family 28 protein [Pyrinomonadaceae bacterium]
MKRFSSALGVLLSVSAVAFELCAQKKIQSFDNTLPSWTRGVGDRGKRKPQKIFLANSFGAKPDGVTNSTKGIQKAIDACHNAGGGIVSFAKGEYVTGAIFLRNNVHLRVASGVTLLGSQDESDYPRLPTRVAGIEMTWPAALINVNDARNVKISGDGTIDGRGQVWWDKYWNLRKEYEPKGLRWASDYDAERVRLMVVWKSSDVTIENLSLKRSGFWTVQVVYSDHVTVDGVKISDNGGPSTDGVDIDSSSHVLVQNCDIDNNDDDICLKAGRDYDGLRVSRPTEYVFIRDNLIRRGGGVIVFGSETSGGIRHVVALNNRGIGTKEGVRFKSAKTRGGFVENVLVRGLKLENVPLPFTFTLNWNPSYSYATIPAGIKNIPAYWTIMNTPVLPIERGYCQFRNITIENVRVTGANRIFTASGLPEKTIQNVTFSNIVAEGKEPGSIEYAENWTMKNVRIKTDSGENVRIANSRNVGAPEAAKK